MSNAGSFRWEDALSFVAQLTEALFKSVQAARIEFSPQDMIAVSESSCGLIVALAAIVGVAPGLFRFRAFLLRCYPRLSLRLMGYRRPPFRLVLWRRKRRTPWKFLLAEGGDSSLNCGYYCSAKAQAPCNACKSPADPPLPDDEYALFLWPDRLRWEYWYFACGVSAPVLLSGEKSGLVMVLRTSPIFHRAGFCRPNIQATIYW
jgi:hypothetical protein